MKLGLALRSMGAASRRDVFEACARAAETAGLDHVWVQDHLAIPPDDAEGSGGRYLDPLTALAFLAAATSRVGLGTGVLNAPYRPPLPTAKALATVQELSGGRLLLGVGVGWMEPEFRALGVDRSRRGRIADETLDFWNRCFANDRVRSNGQELLFLPRPARPPVYVGGAPPHALHRAVRHGDGWMPMGGDPAALAPAIETLHRLAREAGRPAPEVVLMTALPLEDARAARDAVRTLRGIGVTQIVHGTRYDDPEPFRRAAGLLRDLRERLPS